MTVKQIANRLCFISIIVASAWFIYIGLTATQPHMPIARTHAMLQCFSVAIQNYVVDHGSINATSNKEVATLLSGRDNKGSTAQIPYLNFPSEYVAADGTWLDRWRTPYVFEMSPDKKRMSIRSCGPNKRDEGGKGDDIEITFPLVDDASAAK